ncbi:DNA polymerase IV [Halobacteriovorax marinus]|uniref:DNA polymerase IV n=1 Tax=Halobacteriovorax marinus TaxID=97084 RepID=A0A1Y5F325_9BACT|nr:DNA polymerase IV [Halobacteriovorax marinus]
MSQRKIIHIDMDCFYAAVEMRDDPSLRGIPIAIGGPPNSRSVLCTSNYEARKFGVRAAMPSGLAMMKCPKLLILPPNFKKYKEASEAIHEVFAKYTDLVEPLSLDEAFLDVTDTELCQRSATLMAKEIQQNIFNKTGLTASAGVAPNKFLAKIASDWRKPSGLFVITPADIDEFVKDLDIKKIPGIGKVSAEKLNQLGIKTCLDAQAWSYEKLEMCFGKMGRGLYDKCRGIDHREVVPDYDRKSLSVEHTFLEDIPFVNGCLDQIPDLSKELLRRLKNYQNKHGTEKKISKAFIKMKFHDFQTVTVEKKREDEFYKELWLDNELSDEFSKHLEDLTKIAYERGNRAVRLIGVGVRLDHQDFGPKQLKLI